MADLKIGDKVKVTGPFMNGATGEITAKSVRPKESIGKIAIRREHDPEMDASLWQVKLDTTGKLQTFPDAELEKIG